MHPPGNQSLIVPRYASSVPSIRPSNSTPFILADIGEGIAEVEVLQWFVDVGDNVRQFDKICEVQSDKATVEITSRYDGRVLELCGNVGDMIKVGTPLLHLEVQVGTSNVESTPSRLKEELKNMHDYDNDSKLRIPNLQNKNAPIMNGLTLPNGVNGIHSSKTLATPAVRRIAKENNIDLSRVNGTGPRGRVLKADVLNWVREQDLRTINEELMPILDAEKRITDDKRDSTVQIHGVARQMAKHMKESLVVPHMGYADEICIDQLKIIRECLRSIAETEGTRLTYMPFIIKAVSIALSRYPILNASFNEADMTLTYHANHNIGIAMDTSNGLLVPVIKHCQDKSIIEIAKELNGLQSAANEGKLTNENFTGATFSLSNIGAIGGTYMSPVVVPPTIAIG